MPSPSLGDLTGDMAQKLANEAAALPEETLTEEKDLATENKLFSKIRFNWRPEDRMALERVRIQAQAQFDQSFTDLIAVIDGFYELLRIPETRNGIVLRGADGRPVWKKDEQGRIIESWDQLTGQDIEMTLANLMRLRIGIAPRINQLMLEAVYARHVASDIYDEAWVGVMEGTQGDRTALSNRASRKDRYHAYFHFYLHSVADTFLREINAFIKFLENVRHWQVRSQKG